jgi:DNA-binding NtrC family response regulator
MQLGNSRQGDRHMPAKTSIMIVEDDAESRSALAELLRLWGYDAQTACDGVEALDKLTSARPKIIISDFQVPGLSGVELIKAVRRSAPQVSYIVVTAIVGAEKAGFLSGLDIVDCLEKPLDLRRLRQDLQRCLETERPSGDGPFERGQNAMVRCNPSWAAYLGTRG